MFTFESQKYYWANLVIKGEIAMDFLHEAVFLGIDAILLGFCVKEYCSQKQIINALKVSAVIKSENVLSPLLIACIYNFRVLLR